MKKTDNKILIFLFLGTLFFISIFGLIQKDRQFSDNENRIMAQMPQFTVKNILSGDFEKNFQSYEDDQIPGRNGFISVKTSAKQLLGSKDINGVYIGKDGYLIEKIMDEDVDYNRFLKNIAAIDDFYGEIPAKIKKSVIIVPTTGSVMKDKLPKLAVTFDEDRYAEKTSETLGKYNYINLYDEFRSMNNNQLYYKTDHHWTSEGAFIAFKSWMRQCEKENVSRSDYNIVKGSTEFLGTLQSKMLIGSDAKDTVELYKDKGNYKFTVTADGKNIGDIYRKNYLKKKDKYAVFLGGNYGTLQITGGPRNGKNLLIIKDSFANAFSQFAAGKYEKVVMVDLRYFSGNLKELMEKKQVTDVLVLYSMKNLINDKNISILNSKGNILS